MRLAWFAPETDDVALELGRTHHVDRFDARRAHDFVWQHARAPYDLAIFELADSLAHTYVWPYLFHYPGIAVLQATSLQQSRTEALHVQRRRHHLRAERTFGGPSLLRSPLAASRLVVVHDDAVARELRGDYPDVEVRVLPMGVVAPPLAPGSDGTCFRSRSLQSGAIDRAAARAREAGAPVTLAPGLDDVHERDVVIALEWPPTGAPPVDALRAMAAGLPAIVFETEAVAAWPALDPQTWQPRGYASADAPIAISIDPRDEEHSLMLCMRRLSADAGLGVRLGTAAHAWASRHANVEAAARAWEPVLREAVRRTPPGAARALPPHLTEDGTAVLRATLGEMGVAVDF